MKRYYSDIVEHFFRLAVRYDVADTPVKDKWLRTAKAFFSTLEPEDRAFIYDIFNKSHFTTADGLASLGGKWGDNKRKLDDLERAFSEFSGLM